MTLKTWAGAALLASFTAFSMYGQAGLSTGEIRGRVFDSSKALIVGSSVEVVNLDSGWFITVKSGDSGDYQAPSLDPGSYQLKITMAGFTPYVVTGVPVTVGRSTNVDITLQPGPANPVSIDVRTTTPLTDPQRSSQSSTIVSDTLQGLPMDRHDFLALAKLVAGVADSDALADVNDYRVVQSAQSGISFHGNNGRGNSIVVDGGEGNDSGGGIRPTLSQDAVEEFQVNMANFSAELGGASGGLISIISKRGANQRHGSAYGFFRFSGLDAADPFARVLTNGTLERVKPPSNRQQYGATLGGALRPDKTFYFAAFEGLNRDESNSVAVLTDPSIFNPTAAQETILAGLQPGQAAALRQKLTIGPATQELFAVNSGVFPYSGSDYKFSVRLDHLLTPKDQLMFRYNFADLDESNPNARALIGVSRSIDTSRLDNTGSLVWTRFVSSSTVNRLQYQFNQGNFRVSTLEKFGPALDINGFGYFNRDVLLPSNILWRRHDVTDSLTLVRGKHQLKLGGELLIHDNHVESHPFLPGRFVFGELPGGVFVDPALGSTPINSIQAFNLGLPNFYQQGFGDPNIFSTEPYFAGYVQDRWAALPNLTLDFGVRYELDDIRDPIRTDTNNIAPRLGLAWDVSGQRKTIVRAGYGIFYGPTSYALPATVVPLGEINGFRQIAQVFTAINSPGAASAANIYKTLQSQGVITLPVPTRSLTETDISQFGLTVVHDGPHPPGTVLFRAADDFASAYTQQASFGIEHSIGSDWLVSANYLFIRGAKIMRARDENLLPAPVSPTLGIPVWPASGVYFRDPTLLQGNVYESSGNSFYHGMTIEVSRRLKNHIRVTGNYTLSKAIDEVVDYNSDFQATNQLNLRAERALSSFDQRHKFVAYASLESPLKQGNGTLSNIFGNFTLAPLVTINSARPFNLLVGSDQNGDHHPTTDRPPFAGRNTGIGPGYASLDVRLTRVVPISERVKLELMGEAFNLFNKLNFRSVNNTVGLGFAGPFDRHADATLSASQPLGYTSAFDARRFQLGARLTF